MLMTQFDYGDHEIYCILMLWTDKIITILCNKLTSSLYLLISSLYACIPNTKPVRSNSTGSRSDTKSLLPSSTITENQTLQYIYDIRQQQKRKRYVQKRFFLAHTCEDTKWKLQFYFFQIGLYIPKCKNSGIYLNFNLANYCYSNKKWPPNYNK